VSTDARRPHSRVRRSGWSRTFKEIRRLDGSPEMKGLPNRAARTTPRESHSSC
jgi:hypothetical protein